MLNQQKSTPNFESVKSFFFPENYKLLCTIEINNFKQTSCKRILLIVWFRLQLFSFSYTHGIHYSSVFSAYLYTLCTKCDTILLKGFLAVGERETVFPLPR